MRTPIAYALAHPQRMTTSGKTLDWRALKSLDFETPDTERFPALTLAYECLAAGQNACIAFNAANEVAVADFLARKIRFGDIIPTIRKGLNAIEKTNLSTLDDIISYDAAIRQKVARS